LKLVSGNPLKINGKLNTKNIEITGMPKTNFNTDFSLNSKQFFANWKIETLNNSLNINGLLKHNANKGIGKSSIVINDLELNKLDLTEVIGEMPLEIIEGDLKTEMEVSWKLNSHKNDMPPLIQVVGDITLNNLTSNYDGVLIENAYFPIVFDTQSNKPITIKSNASIESVNVGVPIKNIVGEHTITLSQDLTKFIYEAKNIDLQVLGGHISIPEAAYDNSKNVQAVGIYISDLNLSQLDILKEKAGLSATGKLNGALPIVLTQQGISIPAGTLKALTPGGVISHDKNSTVQAFSQGSEQMKMLFEILEKFNYDELSTDVLLKQDGTLSLQCRLQGKNKGYMNGQAINFNPHLNINILDALRVMRITNKTTESLDKMFK
jgi:hypothetical protein